ncbi:Hypothetical predicted protein [Pelobates cultripes]|uniref:Uncharacterized protein n=1 Tax=Pelobates cultripes TaxID=61616 RepID=A0AAD1TGC0_PELCU|nr:Hypothetical predicted protein [Pelobates cultripes]
MGRTTTLRYLPDLYPQSPYRLRSLLLDELRRNIATNIWQFREEINGVSARLQHTELNTADHENRIQTMERQMAALQREQTQAKENMAVMEDKRRWKNIKTRGLPDTLEPAEFPHLFRRMLNTLFPAKQAKAIPLDGWYRIPKPATSTQSNSRDTIICFQQSQDQLAFMAAIRNRSPLQFEEHSLTFFPDLSRATLDWRRSLHPLTKGTHCPKILYRWGAPRSLIIPKEHGDLKLTNAAEIPGIVQANGCSTISADTFHYYSLGPREGAPIRTGGPPRKPIVTLRVMNCSQNTTIIYRTFCNSSTVSFFSLSPFALNVYHMFT